MSDDAVARHKSSYKSFLIKNLQIDEVGCGYGRRRRLEVFGLKGQLRKKQYCFGRAGCFKFCGWLCGCGAQCEFMLATEFVPVTPACEVPKWANVDAKPQIGDGFEPKLSLGLSSSSWVKTSELLYRHSAVTHWLKKNGTLSLNLKVL